MVKISMRSKLKDEAPVIRAAVDQLPFYKKVIFPFFVVGGIIWELAFEFGLKGEEKKLISSIKEKYDVEDVKLHERAIATSPRFVDDFQLTVAQVNGSDYFFLLVIDGRTGDPTLYPAPYIDDSMPYPACPIDPVDLLKEIPTH